MKSQLASAQPSPGSAAQYLTFSLREEVFAMDIRTVCEIIQHGAITSVPLMPAFMRGIINLRGAAVPVIDLQVCFGHAPAIKGKKSCVVIFEAERDAQRVEIGLLVDAVSEVIDIPRQDIEPPPRFGASPKRDFIRGMGKIAGRFVIILELARVLDVDGLTKICEFTQEKVAAYP